MSFSVLGVGRSCLFMVREGRKGEIREVLWMRKFLCCILKYMWYGGRIF